MIILTLISEQTKEYSREEVEINKYNIILEILLNNQSIR
jgi:hypothetical protein